MRRKMTDMKKIMMNGCLPDDAPLAQRARHAWEGMESFRRRRGECKRYAYGNSGTAGMEEQPNTNNLIRQLLKSVIGRYRYLRQGSKVEIVDSSPELERDARGLEEFLISGMVVMRLCRQGEGTDRGRWRNVSPERVFFERFDESDGADCNFVGMLHDIDRGTLLRLFSEGDVERGAAILAAYSDDDASGTMDASPCGRVTTQYDCADSRGNCRVVEVWRRVSTPMLRLHDTRKGEYGMTPYSPETYRRLLQINDTRRRLGHQPVNIILDTDERWEESWMTPAGMLLRRRMHEKGSHPFAMKLYPLIDGEVHSLVEDVLGQQKLVNRMVGLLDDVLSHSAKGVLLFPADQLPEGFTWRDMRRIWSDPGGIIPYRRTSRNVTPQQVQSGGWSAGAHEMLKMQLQLFDEVAGVSASMRGRSGTAGHGADALRQETENATVGMLDLLAAYAAFTRRLAEADAAAARGADAHAPASRATAL